MTHRRGAFWSPRVIALLPRLSIEGTSSLQLPGHSGIQLQVGDVFLDPVLTGVGTDLPASFGLEDDAGLGALAAGLIIVVHEFARDLPGDEGEAAGGRGVGTKGGRAGVGREGRGEQQDSQGGPGDLHDAGR